MAGMYEKLGDLLNETLEAGHVKFVHIEREEAPAEAADSQQAQNAAGPDQVAGGQEAADIPHSDSQNADSRQALDSDQQKAADYAESFYQAETEAEHRYFKTSQDGNRNRSGTGRAGNRRVIYRRVTPELEKAFSLLGLASTAGKEDVKRAYKAKLLYYHPDRYAGKEVMEKVANDKTREVVNAYRLIMEFLS